MCSRMRSWDITRAPGKCVLKYKTCVIIIVIIVCINSMVVAIAIGIWAFEAAVGVSLECGLSSRFYRFIVYRYHFDHHCHH